jgi:hypothetical protein
MGIRVRLILRFCAALPLNFVRVQNLTEARPSRNPSTVNAGLEWPQMVCTYGRRSVYCPWLTFLVIPTGLWSSH